MPDPGPSSSWIPGREKRAGGEPRSLQAQLAAGVTSPGARWPSVPSLYSVSEEKYISLPSVSHKSSGRDDARGDRLRPKRASPQGRRL